jgi:hypothetical protein
VARHDPVVADGSPRWPIAAWIYSVYEEREPLGTMTTTADPKTGDLMIDLEINDDRLANDDVPIEETIRTRRNPHGDLAVLTLRTDEALRSFVVELGVPPIEGMLPLIEFNADGEILNSWPRAVLSSQTNEDAPASHRFQIRVPNVSPDALRAIQVELADNDRTYHTQWRRLAPPGAMLEFGTSKPTSQP